MNAEPNADVGLGSVHAEAGPRPSRTAASRPRSWVFRPSSGSDRSRRARLIRVQKTVFVGKFASAPRGTCGRIGARRGRPRICPVAAVGPHRRPTHVEVGHPIRVAEASTDALRSVAELDGSRNDESDAVPFAHIQAL
jgi:hypothetical protein